MELLNMSTKEISRLEVIQKVTDKRMSQKEAVEILNLGVRQSSGWCGNTSNMVLLD